MNFDLSDEQKLLRHTIRDFAEREIAPGASERDQAGRFPAELIAKLAALGLLGIYIPQDYGGAGLDALSGTVIIEEIARADAAIALIIASHNSLCAGHILGFGNASAKAKISARFGKRRKAGRMGANRAGLGLRCYGAGYPCDR